MVALDGVYVASSDDKPVFRPLPHLKSDEVADVLQVAKTRILKVLERLGAVQVMPDALAVDDAWAARDPVMAQLAAAAVAGLPPAGLASAATLESALRQGAPVPFDAHLDALDSAMKLGTQSVASLAVPASD